MDFSKIVDRARNILTTPKTEWPAIGAEGTTAASIPDLYRNYIVVVAAIPAVIIYNHFSRATRGYLDLVGRASGAVARLLPRDLDRAGSGMISRAAE